jgi:hypothetical protein
MEFLIEIGTPEKKALLLPGLGVNPKREANSVRAL